MSATHSHIDALLRRLGSQPDHDIDLAGAALALGALDRPDTELGPYRVHLSVLAEDARAAAADAATLSARVEALNGVLFGRHRYRGDTETYDDLENANLLSVIDRRRGLPIALSILYIATARALGWDAIGVNFPGHFLVRLDAAGERALVDPFHGGALREPADLRALLKGLQGMDAELRPEHYAPAGNRAILLRLQNNIKSRLIAAGDFERALAVVERMAMMAPGEAGLWHELGVLHARLGNLRAAITALETFAQMAPPGRARQQALHLLREVQSRLN
ncbi:MAG TPA: transglutaminase-like domain-containing protein [Alphaproteobacteria bacterium]|jgi:regulator of sirC expression with transglutaminase-like and TPR domain|nr:transglutaminase-like domain-containing protein [Alphaproteobacteria bacterium]